MGGVRVSTVMKKSVCSQCADEGTYFAKGREN